MLSPIYLWRSELNVLSTAVISLVRYLFICFIKGY